MKIFTTTCKNIGSEVGWSLIIISIFYVSALGHSLSNARVKKDSASRAHRAPGRDLFKKPFCRKVKLRLLTADEYDEVYDLQEDVETELEKAQPGCGPPIDVEYKIANKSAFQISWLSQTPQVLPLKYFILEYEQAKEDDKPVTKCRQWVQNESDKKNETFTHHSTVVGDLITDHKYQFRVISVYNDYQHYPADKSPWLYLPGDGAAPRVTHPPGFTPEPMERTLAPPSKKS